MKNINVILKHIWQNLTEFKGDSEKYPIKIKDWKHFYQILIDQADKIIARIEKVWTNKKFDKLTENIDKNYYVQDSH